MLYRIESRVSSQFARAAEDLGFGALAHDLFIELDPDGSGNISYYELMDHLRKTTNKRVEGVSRTAKRFLAGVAFSVSDLPDTVNPDLWNLTAGDPDQLREQICTVLAFHPTVRVVTLYALMSLDGSVQITRGNLRDALVRIGYKGADERSFLDELFRDIDSDHSGFLGIHDLNAWITRRVKRSDATKQLKLLRKPVDGCVPVALGLNAVQYPCPLKEVEWNVPALRTALQLMLIHAQLAPLDLLREWDKDESGSFSKQEFVRMMKRIVGNEDLWDDELRDVALAAFKEVSRGDTRIDVVEFEVWLNVGWLSLKRDFTGQPIQPVQSPACSPPHATPHAACPSTSGPPSTIASRRRSPRRLRRPSSAASSTTSSLYDLGASRGYAGRVYEEAPRREPKAPRRRRSGNVHAILLAPPPPQLTTSLSMGELSHAHRTNAALSAPC